MIVSFLLASSIYLPSVHAVSILTKSCTSQDTNSSVCQDGNGAPSATNPIFGPSGILTEVIQIIAYIVGIASIIIIIISGLRMVLSGGDPNNVSSARNSILYALIGVAIALSAQGIVVFVLQKV